MFVGQCNNVIPNPMLLTTHDERDIRVLRWANPPVNVLSVQRGVVAALGDAVNGAVADESVRALVIAGDGANFCAGADISDFDGDPEALEQIRSLLCSVESSPKPVVIAIDGFCLGAGLELATAGHYRIATSRATLGTPEVTLGLLPGAGGTQRLPRLVGAIAALKLMLEGKPIGAHEAQTLGLVDEVTSQDVVGAAVAFIATHRPSARPTGSRPVPADLQPAVEGARSRAKLSRAQEYIVNCVECVRTQSLTEGLVTEARYFGQLLASEESKALRHGFWGRRKAARIPGVEHADSRRITTVAVVGAGLMGTGITLAVLKAGLKVVVVDPNEESRQRIRAAIPDSLRRDRAKGRLSAEQMESQLAAFSCEPHLEAGRSAQLFIEAVFEDMTLKRSLFAELDQVAASDAILASNTSTLDLDQIASATRRPERVVGLHFFSPAHIMRLLEIVRGNQTSAETLASALTFAKALGKSAVVAGVCDGFIGNRMFEEYLRQAYFLVEEGALPQQVDRALEAWGMAMGPFRTMDLAGQDIGWKIRARRAQTQPDRPYSKFLDRVYELGRLGQKTGAGVYLYPDGRIPQVDPQIDALARRESLQKGITRREIPDEEITSRCILALINEGAKILEEKIAYRPVDIDVVYLDGYGFPAERGGPMYYADRRGLREVLQSLSRLQQGREGWAFEPARLLVDLAAHNGSFASLNH
jgi:3-hydroxyacyl-CoA dehydrogenase